MYLTATKPDILFAVSILSRFMHCASEVHLQAAKRVVRYIKDTLDYDVKYSHSHNFKLYGYSDSDWAGCVDNMRSTTGYCFTFGSGVFSWLSKKQEVITQSTSRSRVCSCCCCNKSGPLDQENHDRFAYGTRREHTYFCG